VFAEEISILMDSQDAAKYLGLNKHVFEQLVKHRHIPGVRKTQNSHWKFTAAILDEFVKRLVGKTNASHDAHDDIEEVSLVAKRLSCKSEHIIELILKDELKAVVRLSSKMAIQSIGVSVDEVKTVMTVPLGLGCTRVEAAQRLKISRNTTKQLLKTGYLSEKTIRCSHGRKSVRIVTSDSMAQFEEKYVSLGQLARSLDRVPGPLAMHLTSRGIHPLESVREISNIYLKTQIPDL